MPTPAATGVEDRRAADLTVAELYGLLRLRVDVFVVEQSCPYPELDGRDTEPGTRHVWVGDAGAPLGPDAYLRVMEEADGSLRVGRVVTAAAARGRGLAGVLVSHVLAGAGARPVVLDAQSHLEGWYAGLGFVRTGPEFVEDGIPHVPMRHPPATPA